jgi:hypothetical protein
MISICRDRSSNVKNWQDEQMVLPWCAAGMIEAGKQFAASTDICTCPPSATPCNA